MYKLELVEEEEGLPGELHVDHSVESKEEKTAELRMSGGVVKCTLGNSTVKFTTWPSAQTQSSSCP